MPDIVTSKTFIDGEKGITAAKLNQIISGAVIQPSFYTAKPVSPVLDPTDVFLELKNTGSYAQITGSQLISSISSTISSARPRSFNAIGNPNFEIDQRQAGTLLAVVPATNNPVIDRWWPNLAGTGRVSAQQIAANVAMPGTNFFITQNIWRITVTTANASLAATDQVVLTQAVEGPVLRELLGDAHSISILARSSVANLSFGLALQDNTATHTLSKLCTLGAANTWTLLTYPNLPIWPAAGTFPTAPGGVGYSLLIVLAAGTGKMAAANDTWQAASTFGAVGQSNFLATAATFDLAFVQHEPGSACNALIDIPFAQNHSECLRHFSKSYSYGTKPGAATTSGIVTAWNMASNAPYNYVPFRRTMAKIPTLTAYSATGAKNMVQNASGPADLAVVAVNAAGDSGFSGFNVTAPASVWYSNYHYIADTGW